VARWGSKIGLYCGDDGEKKEQITYTLDQQKVLVVKTIRQGPWNRMYGGKGSLKRTGKQKGRPAIHKKR